METTTVTRKLKIFCPTHQSVFEVEEKPQIICEIREHALSNNFPQSEFWEFCCDCQTFSPSSFGTGGKAKDVCRHCERKTTRRFLCDECKIVAYESDEDAKGKIFGIGTEGVKPDCPGCRKTFGETANQHQCGDIEGALMTHRAECPFCQKLTLAKAEPKQVEPIPHSDSAHEKSDQFAPTQCPNCGHWGPAGRIHCGKCGIQINAPVAGVMLGTSVPRTQLLGSICPNCGAANLAGSVFCNSCGQALKSASTGEINNPDRPVFMPPQTIPTFTPEQQNTFSGAQSATGYFQPPTPPPQRKNPVFTIAIGLFAFAFIGGFIAYINSSRGSVPANNSASSNNSMRSNSTNMYNVTNYKTNTSNTNYSSSTTNMNSLSSTANTNSSSSSLIGREGRLTINAHIRVAPYKNAESRGTHYEDAKIEVLEVNSYPTEDGPSTWYKVRVLENGCDRKEGNGCGNDWVRDGYKYYGEAEMEGWMNAKNIVLD